MKRSLLLLFVFCTPLLAAEAVVEESNIDEELSTSAEEDAPIADINANENDAASSAVDRLPPGTEQDDFVPTVRISEDLSVSFPVDI